MAASSRSILSPVRSIWIVLLTGCFSGALSPLPALAAPAPAAKILERRVISREPQYYLAWATAIRRQNGDLMVAYSGGRDGHVCPFGRVDLIVSHNEGKTWSWPRTILDSDTDDRDAGILETAKGTLIVTTFTATSYEQYLNAAEKAAAGAPLDSIPSNLRRYMPSPERLPDWQAARDRIPAAERKAQAGPWFIRSTDGGISWSPQMRVPVNSPHGPIALKDGRLLYLGKRLGANPPSIGACESTDDGLTWQWLSEIPVRPGDTVREYHELHAVEAANGTLIGHIRTHNETYHRETLQVESTDGGKTWSVPHSIGVWGLPSHLLKLKDGRLVMTYGHRRKPYGNQARVSNDHGRTWSDPIMLSPDSNTNDLGYPSTVELADGSLLSVWYEKMPNEAQTSLRQAHWTLAP